MILSKKITQNAGRKQDFSEKKTFRIAAALDLNKCLKQVKLLISLHMFAPLSELTSNINTMALSKQNFFSGNQRQIVSSDGISMNIFADSLDIAFCYETNAACPRRLVEFT